MVVDPRGRKKIIFIEDNRLNRFWNKDEELMLINLSGIDNHILEFGKNNIENSLIKVIDKSRTEDE
jgi:hypothetical protein